MRITLTLDEKEIKEAIANSYGVEGKNVSLCRDLDDKLVAIVDGVDPTGDIEETDEATELEAVKEKINKAMKRITGEMLVHEHGDDKDDCISNGLAIAAAIFADELGIEIIEL